MADPTPPGAENFMTVDAFDVELNEGADSAVVTKDHSGPMGEQGRTAAEHTEAIAREINWLHAAAQVPGVVRLAGPPADGPPAAVITEYAGARTMRSDCPDERSTATVLIQVCRTVTGLESVGLIHGSITPEHIIIGADLTTKLCSPNTSDDPIPDLVSIGRCIEYATEQWTADSDRIEQWLLLAKRLRDRDPSLSPDRVASQLETLGEGSENRTGPRRRLLAGLVIAVTAAAGALLSVGGGFAADPTVSGPVVEVDGLIVQVGQTGQIALARPADDCSRSRVYLLDPVTFRIWTFDELLSGRAGTSLAMVPGATDLKLSRSEQCTKVLATGPGGTVVLD